MVPHSLGGGRYEMEGLLGHGGMADVRKARDVRLGRTVAIKRLRADLASDPTFRARFRREAQSAASLNHPSVVAVYDTGEETATDGSGISLPYIVMEYVEGRTLRDILREGRKILPERALEIVSTVLTALDYSHRAGIIHRDIKPANVMLTPTGDVKVMDFGIARAIADASASMTQTAAVIGTAQYLSPEQARGEQVDARSDLYSTGCLLYELLTGRPPFVGDSPVSVAYQHVREEAPAPSTLDPEISPEIDAITLKALCKPVDERYQSATEMRSDIARALEGKEVLAAPVVGATELETQHFLAQPPLDPAPTTVNPSLAGVDDRRRSRAALWAGLFLLVAALVVGGLVIVPQLLASDAPTQAEVPALKGMTVEEADNTLRRAGLELGKRSPGSSTSIGPGRVMYQTERPGDQINQGSEVGVTVVTGPKTVTIPTDIAEMDLATATKALAALKLKVDSEPDGQSSERRNQVTSTDPAPGTPLQIDDEVTVFYSTGLVDVPSVIGMSQQGAEALLRSKGLDPLTSDAESDAPVGQVTDQRPQADTRRARGSDVVITVSLGPPPTATESVLPPTTAPTTPPTTTPTTPTTPPTSTPTSPTPSTTAPTSTSPAPSTSAPTSTATSATTTAPTSAATKTTATATTATATTSTATKPTKPAKPIKPPKPPKAPRNP